MDFRRKTCDHVRGRAERANSRGLALQEKGWHEEAEAAYRKAAGLDPAWSVPWFNLGLLAKRRRRWSESLEFNRRATELDSTDEGAWWNLGIAATALGDWVTARAAWRGFGLPIPDGEGPLELNMGPVPIRLDPNHEVVWCRRVDPARAIVKSVPLPESGHGFDDLILNDGAPNGWRWHEGKEVPVFDEIAVLRRSAYRTFQLRARVRSPKDIQTLAELAFASKLAAEDWSTVEYLCAECSKGTPDNHHLHEAPEWKPDRLVGIAAPDVVSLERLLAEWRRSSEALIFEVELVWGEL